MKLSQSVVKPAIFGFSFVALFFVFQNCSKVDFKAPEDKVTTLAVCSGISCTLDPITKKPAVTTILLALGDEANSQLVVDGASAQLIAETVVRYTSPKADPKILLVRDHNESGESPEDTIYARDVLLKRYNVTYIDEPAAGLTDSDLAGYDVIWFNNPGHPMGSEASRDALIRFPGGVILQGDDLTWGEGGFSLEALTGLHFVDNGTSVGCGGVDYRHDDNGGEQYRVTLDPNKIPGASSATINFRYGNDIDNSTVARPDLEVLASAKGGPAACTDSRPTIVRYLK